MEFPLHFTYNNQGCELDDVLQHPSAQKLSTRSIASSDSALSLPRMTSILIAAEFPIQTISPSPAVVGYPSNTPIDGACHRGLGNAKFFIPFLSLL